jgi:uncharacterized protein YdaU (DUF1376 family)
MHYFAWKPKAYNNATLHLTREEDLAYRRLLDHQYETELPIPINTESVSRRLRLDKPVVDSVLSEFFELGEDGYWNPQAKAAIAQYNRRLVTNQANGKLGGRPSKTQSVSTRKPKANRGKSDIKGNHESVISNQESNNPHSPPQGDVDFASLLIDVSLEGDDSDQIPGLESRSNTKPRSKNPPAKKERGGRAPNEQLDALVLHAGRAADVGKVTGPFWAEAAAALRNIKEVEPGVTPEAIRLAAQRYIAEWGADRISPSALAKHWARFSCARSPAEASTRGKFDTHAVVNGSGAVRPPPTPDWHEWGAQNLGWNLPPCTPWDRVPSTMRAEFLSAFPSNP